MASHVNALMVLEFDEIKEELTTIIGKGELKKRGLRFGNNCSLRIRRKGNCRT